jgi:hypothetical protein
MGIGDYVLILYKFLPLDIKKMPPAACLRENLFFKQIVKWQAAFLYAACHAACRLPCRLPTIWGINVS